MRMTGARERMRPTPRDTAASAASALYMTVHVAPSTTSSPAMIHTEKSHESLPTSAS